MKDGFPAMMWFLAVVVFVLAVNSRSVEKEKDSSSIQSDTRSTVSEVSEPEGEPSVDEQSDPAQDNDALGLVDRRDSEITEEAKDDKESAAEEQKGVLDLTAAALVVAIIWGIGVLGASIVAIIS